MMKLKFSRCGIFVLIIAGVILISGCAQVPQAQQRNETSISMQKETNVGMKLNIVEEGKLLVEVPNPKILRNNFLIELENMPANEVVTLNISERSAGITTNNDGKGEALICADDIDDEAGDCILTFPKSEDLDIQVIILDNEYKLTVPTADDKPMVFIDTELHAVPVKFLGSEWVINDLKKSNVKDADTNLLNDSDDVKIPTTTTTPTPTTTPTSACTWTCGSWGACPSSGTQTRTCTSSPSPCTGTNPNPTSQSCTPELTCDTGALGSCLSGNCVSVYGPGGSADCPERCNINGVYDNSCLTNQCNVPYQNCIAACHTSNPPCTINEVYAVLETLSS